MLLVQPRNSRFLLQLARHLWFFCITQLQWTLYLIGTHQPTSLGWGKWLLIKWPSYAIKDAYLFGLMGGSKVADSDAGSYFQRTGSRRDPGGDKKPGLYFMRPTDRLAASRPRNKSYEPNIGIDRHRDGSACRPRGIDEDCEIQVQTLAL